MAMESGLAPTAAVGHDAQEIVEFPLLLTSRQVEALSRASQSRGISAGELARRAIKEFLARGSTVHRVQPDDGRGFPFV